MNPSFAVQKFLAGLRYPARKQTIVVHARERGAGEEVIAALLSLPDRAYESPVSVSREIGRRAELSGQSA